MIIFDLDGTLADCEHRRHYVDPRKNKDYFPRALIDLDTGIINDDQGKYVHVETGERFKPDWKSFYNECDKDEPITPCLCFLESVANQGWGNVMIWSGRCESTKDKTINWLLNNWFYGWDLQAEKYISTRIKMRPEGDSTPDDVLKESWLDELIKSGKKVDFVVDDRPKVVEMWRRRGIFVFDVNQSGHTF